jgi:ADP-ribose pyrophosphatase YjhB (NUDIX family)
MIPEPTAWLDWCSRLQAIAQTGLTFARDPYDIERYKQIRELSEEMLAAGSGAKIEFINDLLEKDAGYATPKIDVRAVVFRGDRLLLIREKTDGCWAPPGGWGDPGESLSENVVREVWEESGYRVRATKLLAVFDRAKHPHEPQFPYHIYKHFIRCEIIGGSATESIETDGAEFFAENALPELSNTRITSWQVHRMFEHLRNPNLDVDFD